MAQRRRRECDEITRRDSRTGRVHDGDRLPERDSCNPALSSTSEGCEGPPAWTDSTTKGKRSRLQDLKFEVTSFIKPGENKCLRSSVKEHDPINGLGQFLTITISLRENGWRERA